MGFPSSRPPLVVPVRVFYFSISTIPFGSCTIRLVGQFIRDTALRLKMWKQRTTRNGYNMPKPAPADGAGRHSRSLVPFPQ